MHAISPVLAVRAKQSIMHAITLLVLFIVGVCAFTDAYSYICVVCKCTAYTKYNLSVACDDFATFLPSQWVQVLGHGPVCLARLGSFLFRSILRLLCSNSCGAPHSLQRHTHDESTRRHTIIVSKCNCRRHAQHHHVVHDRRHIHGSTFTNTRIHHCAISATVRIVALIRDGLYSALCHIA